MRSIRRGGTWKPSRVVTAAGHPHGPHHAMRATAGAAAWGRTHRLVAVEVCARVLLFENMVDGVEDGGWRFNVQPTPRWRFGWCDDPADSDLSGGLSGGAIVGFGSRSAPL